jgi:hypothetical protein
MSEEGAVLRLLNRLEMRGIRRQRGGQLGGRPVRRRGSASTTTSTSCCGTPHQAVGALRPRQFGQKRLMSVATAKWRAV